MTVDIDNLIHQTAEHMQDHIKEAETLLAYADQSSNLTQRAEFCRKAAASFDRASATSIILNNLFDKRRNLVTK
jgi:hypothetical protein